MSASRLSAIILSIFAIAAFVAIAPAQTTKNISANADTLINQPIADYQARRRALMQQIKDIEAKRTADARFGRQRVNPNQQSDFTYVPIIVIFGQDEGDIGEGKYRQKNYFAYLTGVETPSAYMILLPNEGSETLYIPPRDLANERWTGVQIGPGPEAAKKFGFQHVESTEQFMGDLFQVAGDP